MIREHQIHNKAVKYEKATKLTAGTYWSPLTFIRLVLTACVPRGRKLETANVGSVARPTVFPHSWATFDLKVNCEKFWAVVFWACSWLVLRNFRLVCAVCARPSFLIAKQSHQVEQCTNNLCNVVNLALIGSHQLIQIGQTEILY